MWYKNICSASFSFVTIHACDRRTDRITTPKTALAYARAVKIKNSGFDEYGAEPIKQQQFGTAGVEGVNSKILFQFLHRLFTNIMVYRQFISMVNWCMMCLG